MELNSPLPLVELELGGVQGTTTHTVPSLTSLFVSLLLVNAREAGWLTWLLLCVENLAVLLLPDSLDVPGCDVDRVLGLLLSHDG